MKKAAYIAVSFLALTQLTFAADAATGGGPKGTLCFSNSLMVPGQSSAVINCKGLGNFTSIAEIYDRGYRVANSGFIPESRPGLPPLTYSMYFIIEERR